MIASPGTSLHSWHYWYPGGKSLKKLYITEEDYQVGLWYFMFSTNSILMSTWCSREDIPKRNIPCGAFIPPPYCQKLIESIQDSTDGSRVWASYPSTSERPGPLPHISPACPEHTHTKSNMALKSNWNIKGASQELCQMAEELLELSPNQR